jgi:hypothetical protein
MEQTLTPNDTIVNLAFKIPKNLVGKKLKVYIDFEKKTFSIQEIKIVQTCCHSI